MRKLAIHSGNRRTALLAKNVLASFIVKGWSAAIVFLMLPLTLKCLGEYRNGVWLTISGLLVWIDQMDIGLGNGLRNSLAKAVAHDDWGEAQRAVSSALAMLVCVMAAVTALLSLLVWHSDIYSLFNVDPQIVPELRTAILAAVLLVGVTFIFKITGNVYNGLQLPAVNYFLLTAGQTLALLATWLLYKCGEASLLNIVVANTLPSLAVFLLAYPYTFGIKYKRLRPAWGKVNLRSALDLTRTGVKFFWINISAGLLMTSTNFLLSAFFTPAMVTPYQMAYRYMSILLVAFTVVGVPFWSATTDAYERGDLEWIRNASRRMNRLMVAIAVCMAAMTACSPLVYHLWIEPLTKTEVAVPLSVTAMTALYMFIVIYSMRYSIFLSGVNALMLQIYMTAAYVLFIPLAWVVNELTHSVTCFLATMCFCLLPGLTVNRIQFHKILNGTATGFWRIR